MSLNSQSINNKFDELRLFINRISKVEEIGVDCLQKHGLQKMKTFVYFNHQNINYSIEKENVALKISHTEPYVKQHVMENIYKPHTPTPHPLKD